jgi:hypothetical protein
MTQTTENLLSYYANLLIYQYVSRWRAYNTVYSLVEPILMSQGFELLLINNEGQPIVNNEGNYVYVGAVVEPVLPLALQNAFNLPGAVGAQLDILAKYLGGQRTNQLLDGTYYTLNDTQFTEYLLILAARNGLASDLGDVQAFLTEYFTVGGAQVLLVHDYANMQMSFTYTAAGGAYPVLEAFIMLGNLPKPMGVGASFIHNPTVKNFFAFRTYTQAAQPNTVGFNFYTAPQVGTFVSYAYGLSVPS